MPPCPRFRGRIGGWELLQSSRHHCLVLHRGHAAGGVQQPALRLQHGEPSLQNGALHLRRPDGFGWVPFEAMYNLRGVLTVQACVGGKYTSIRTVKTHTDT